MAYGEINTTDWVSAVSGLVAAFVSIITLFTVYIGAMQLLSQNRMYRHGLSWRSVGPWKSTVARWQLLGLGRRIMSPTVNLGFLVENNWHLQISFPRGFPKSNPKKRRNTKNSENPNDVEKGEKPVMAKSSWVNFMQALGLSPEESNLYELRDAPELLNGTIPMHWTGKDLVGLCSILGFQSHEDSPSFKTPMPLPMQWSGPLGWLQFRSSPNGCVVEFRSRMDIHNQISLKFHKHYEEKQSDNQIPSEADPLRSRLWNSINGLALHDSTLYLGGADRRKIGHNEEEKSDQALLEDLMAQDLAADDIIHKMFGKMDVQPNALRSDVDRNGALRTQQEDKGDKDTPDFLASMLRDTVETFNKKKIFVPCKGLLSVTVEGELAFNRGLGIRKCFEYVREFKEDHEIDHKMFPYCIGDLYMDDILIDKLKEALLLLWPDGYYFSPTARLARDLNTIYDHIEQQSNVLEDIFPAACIQRIKSLSNSVEASGLNNKQGQKVIASKQSSLTPSGTASVLPTAMELCNDLQSTRKTARATYSVNDMRLIARACAELRSTLKEELGENWGDVVWAILYCRDLPKAVLQTIKELQSEHVFNAKVYCKDGQLDFSALVVGSPDDEEDNGDDESIVDSEFSQKKIGYSKLPCVEDQSFSGRQVLTAMALIFITYYWTDNRWITDVAVYDATMPQSVLMC
ncbi:hypothetical protein TARUN_7782 [Trichoderma arundinaceum]|uniref:Uncharacterized protein n=1 Tax=Trichoderma arundinaceum TaxID=490622 RepID=A0A395NF37_TRIAR|nr:hypothetical protein TARUN_7782 [Trichoderma arundinaceum]